MGCGRGGTSLRRVERYGGSPTSEYLTYLQKGEIREPQTRLGELERLLSPIFVTALPVFSFVRRYGTVIYFPGSLLLDSPTYSYLAASPMDIVSA